MQFQTSTQRIIRSFYKVYNKLGYGFLEKVYENALKIELRKQGFEVAQQEQIRVLYEDHFVDDYYADLIVDNQIILELKAAEALCVEHGLQLLNYLKATEIEVGLLFDFEKTPQFKRKNWENNRQI